jgi:hypothetical protein
MTIHIAKRGQGAAQYADVAFLDSARSDDSTRAFMAGIHVETVAEPEPKTILVSTDGRRLHMATWEGAHGPAWNDIPAGEYNLIKGKGEYILETVENPAAFPEWRRVTPDYTGRPTIAVAKSDKKYAAGADLAHAIVNVFQHTGATLNADYVSDIIAADSWTVQGAEYPKGAEKPVLFTNHTKVAVVMPMAPACK